MQARVVIILVFIFRSNYESLSTLSFFFLIHDLTSGSKSSVPISIYSNLTSPSCMHLEDVWLKIVNTLLK